MRFRRVLSAVLIALAPVAAHAQFYGYPSFQIPRTTPREYNFAIANAGDAGTSLLFQWREAYSPTTHLQFDAGLADPNRPGDDARFIIGGGMGHQLHTATSDLPLDLLVSAGAGGSFGGGVSYLRVPVGLSVGRRFPFDVPVAVTPYAHPRLTLDHCSACGAGGRSDTKLGVDADLGVDVELTTSLALRGSLLLSGSDFFGRGDGFGVSLVWTPATLK